MRRVIAPADDSLTVFAAECLLYQFLEVITPFRTGNRVHPSVFDVEVVDDIESRLGVSEFKKLFLCVFCRHLHGIAGHEGLSGTPCTEVGRAVVRVARVDLDILQP